jgi:hypothetical protein
LSYFVDEPDNAFQTNDLFVVSGERRLRRRKEGTSPISRTMISMAGRVFALLASGPFVSSPKRTDLMPDFG